MDGGKVSVIHVTTKTAVTSRQTGLVNVYLGAVHESHNHPGSVSSLFSSHDLFTHVPWRSSDDAAGIHAVATAFFLANVVNFKNVKKQTNKKQANKKGPTHWGTHHKTFLRFISLCYVYIILNNIL